MSNKLSLAKNDAVLFVLATIFGIVGILGFFIGTNYALSSLVQFAFLQIFIFCLLFLMLFSQALTAYIVQKRDRAESGEDMPAQTVKKNRIRQILTIPPARLLKIYYAKIYPAAMLCMILFYALACLLLPDNTTAAAAAAPPPILGVVLIFFSFAYLFAANVLLLYNDRAEGRTDAYTSIGSFFKASQFFSFLIGIVVFLKYFGYPQAENVLALVVSFFMLLLCAELFVQAIIRLANGRTKQNPVIDFYVISTIASGKNPITGLFFLLENKTGISFRSTWTIRYIRNNLGAGLLAVVLILWLSTAFAQVNAGEQGLLYKFGELDETEVLEPGIHLKWPWPIGAAKVYPVAKVNSFTVGYETEKEKDYLWTMSHGGEEYKLLLGDGKELVSINMKVYYKISDLHKYVLQFDNPEEKLKAEAYRILLYETVTTNLDHLLSRDRSSFACTIKQKLSDISLQQNLGIEVTDIALISIHPPIEVASFYQQIVSANIIKKTAVIKAASYSDALIPKNENKKNVMIKNAQIEAIGRKAKATSDAVLYDYEIMAHDLNPIAYREQKWLEMLVPALSDKQLYLVDKKLNVDGGSCWLDLRGMNSGEIKKELPTIDVELPPRD